MTPVRLRRVAAALLIVSGILLLAGRVAEDSSHDESTEAAGAHAEDSERAEGEGHAEGAEASEADEAAEATESGETSEAEHSEAAEGAEEETILGIDIESPAAVIAALAVSVLLALGLLSSKARPFAFAALGLGVVFALFDVAELAHQIDESRAGIALVAGLVAVGHLAASGAAGLSLRDAPA